MNGFRLKAGEYFGSVELDDFHGGVGKTTFLGDSTDEFEDVRLSLFSGMTRPLSLVRALLRRCSSSDGVLSKVGVGAVGVVGWSWTELLVRPLGLGGPFLLLLFMDVKGSNPVDPISSRL